MPAVLVHAEERSAFYVNAPTASAIEAALRGAATDGGGWVGAHARVTRTSTPGERFATRVAWVYAWPASQFPEATPAMVSGLRQRCAAALDALSFGWQGVSVVPYSAAVHGSVAWWTSGQSAITRSRDEFPELAGRTGPADNPIGPTTPETHPPTVGDVVGGAASTFEDVAPWLLGFGLLGLGIYAWKD